MIEHLMSSSLSGDHQGCAAGFIRLHVRGLSFSSIADRMSCRARDWLRAHPAQDHGLLDLGHCGFFFGFSRLEIQV
jgi:hypothetical protein